MDNYAVFILSHGRAGKCTTYRTIRRHGYTGKIYLILDKNEHKNLLKSYKIFVYYNDDDSMIKKIEVNTLITTGENDVGSTPEMSSNLSKMIRGSKFVEIKKGKHLCSIECADNVNITFKKFIDQHND